MLIEDLPLKSVLCGVFWIISAKGFTVVVQTDLQIFPHLIALLLFLCYIFWIRREPWHGIKHGIDPFLKGWNILQGLSIAACLYCGDLKLMLGVQARDRLWGGGSPAGPGAVSPARGIWD
jgi:hypothetical protein